MVTYAELLDATYDWADVAKILEGSDKKIPPL